MSSLEPDHIPSVPDPRPTSPGGDEVEVAAQATAPEASSSARTPQEFPDTNKLGALMRQHAEAAAQVQRLSTELAGATQQVTELQGKLTEAEGQLSAAMGAAAHATVLEEVLRQLLTAARNEHQAGTFVRHRGETMSTRQSGQRSATLRDLMKAIEAAESVLRSKGA